MASLTPPEPPHVVDAWVDPIGPAYRIVTDKALIVGPKSTAGMFLRVSNQLYSAATAATSAGAPTDVAGSANLINPSPGPDYLQILASCTALTAPDTSKVAPGTYSARTGP